MLRRGDKYIRTGTATQGEKYGDDEISVMVTYTHIDRDCNHHGLLEQNLERFGKDIFGAFKERKLVVFHRCIIALVSGLLALPPGEFDKNNRPEDAMSVNRASLTRIYIVLTHRSLV